VRKQSIVFGRLIGEVQGSLHVERAAGWMCWVYQAKCLGKFSKTPWPPVLLTASVATPNDKVVRLEVCGCIVGRTAQHETCSSEISFSAEATFHLSQKVNRRNIHVWGSEGSRAAVEHLRDSPKINIFYALSRDKV
jgi:hypothetical protein